MVWLQTEEDHQDNWLYDNSKLTLPEPCRLSSNSTKSATGGDVTHVQIIFHKVLYDFCLEQQNLVKNPSGTLALAWIWFWSYIIRIIWLK